MKLKKRVLKRKYDINAINLYKSRGFKIYKKILHYYDMNKHAYFMKKLRSTNLGMMITKILKL